MTMATRNLTLRLALLVAAGILVAGAVALVRFPVAPSAAEWMAVTAAATAALLGFTISAIYIRLFRRSPAISVFFVTWYLLLLVLDAVKIAQLILPVVGWPQFAPLVSRVSLFGHILGVMALFGGGLYAGGVRMQRHGTAMGVATLIAVGMSWMIPVDTAVLPPNLVYPAGLRSSLDATLLLLVVVSVINYLQAVITRQEWRRLVGVVAVAMIASGREMLFYLTSPVAVVVAAALLIAGAILFAAQNYRDLLLN